MMAQPRTTGESRAELLKLRSAARNKSHEARLKEFGKGDQTETELAFSSFDDGWNAGYKAGFQQALSVALDTHKDSIAALRSSMMANGLEW